MDDEKAREVQSELAEWEQAGPRCWGRRLRDWSKPLDKEELF